MPRKIYITQNEDDADVFRDVATKLEQRGAEVYDINGGHSEWDDINNIKTCQFIWLVTKNSVHGAGCKLEVLTVLERAFKENKINAVLLMYGDVTDQLLRLSVLDVMERIQMKLNPDDTWQESQVDDVLAKLAGDNDVRQRFPAGNLSHGFAYSHFFGFHNVVLDHFEGKIKQSSWYKENSNCFPLKIYELVPRTCQIAFKITDKDPRVKFVGMLEKIEVIRAGHKLRPYSLPVYTFQDDGKDYYFIAQFPNAISAMVGMKEKKVAKMDDVDIRVQLTRYYYTMERLLNHPNKQSYHDKVRQLLYNDENEKPFDVLRAAVKKDLPTSLEEGNSAQDHYNLTVTVSAPFERLSMNDPEGDPIRRITPTIKLYDACIVNSQNSKDKRTALEVEKALKKRNIIIYLNETDTIGMDNAQSLQTAIDQSRWIVLILSKESLEDCTFYEPSWIASAANKSKFAMIIPVLVDISAEQIPDMLKWLLYLPVHPDQPSRFLQEMDSLHNYIKGTNVEMSFENHLPAGNVGYGLAWGYALNYLGVVLKDFPKYIPKAFQRNGIADYTCPEKLYIMVPETCAATGLLSDKRERVEHCFKLVEIDDRRAGTNIIKTLDVYSVVDTSGKKYYFVGQFPTAVTCLYEMMEIGNAGINDDSMKRESRNFCDTIQQILEQVIGEALASRCQFLDFNDTVPTGLEDVLIPRILKESNKKRNFSAAFESYESQI